MTELRAWQVRSQVLTCHGLGSSFLGFAVLLLLAAVGWLFALCEKSQLQGRLSLSGTCS